MQSKYSPVRGSDPGWPKWPIKKEKIKYAFPDPVPDLDRGSNKKMEDKIRKVKIKNEMTTFQPILLLTLKRQDFEQNFSEVATAKEIDVPKHYPYKLLI
jgi:hypothetical protein